MTYADGRIVDRAFSMLAEWWAARGATPREWVVSQDVVDELVGYSNVIAFQLLGIPGTVGADLPPNSMVLR